jgi:predicted nucleic acid-binding protein
MKLYFDTSALVKYFYEEQGSDIVTELVQDESNSLFISEIAIVEFISSLHKKYRNLELSNEDLETAQNEFIDSLTDFTIEPFTSKVRQEAEKLIIKYGKEFSLKTLDAMQLATFIMITDGGTKFVCADDNLNRIVEFTGNQYINTKK